MGDITKINVASKHFSAREIEEHRVTRNAEIQRDIFHTLKSANLPDNIDKILGQLDKPGDIYHKLIGDEIDVFFDYLNIALGIESIQNQTLDGYKTIIELELGNKSKTNCGYHPKIALFLAHMRAYGIGKDVIKLFQEKIDGYGLTVPNSHECIPLISDDYLKLILNSELGMFQTLDFITSYFGSNRRCYRLFNDLDIDLAEKIIELFNYASTQKYFYGVNKIEPDRLLMLSKSHIQRLIDMSDEDMKSFFKLKKDDLLLRLCIEDDREFNKTLNWIKYDLHGPEHKGDAGLL